MILMIAKFLIARNPALTMGHAQRLAKLAVVALAAVALAAGIAWWQAAQRAHDAENRRIGATIQREEDLRVTIKRTEQAHETRDIITKDYADGAGRSCQLYNRCLRTARTPGNCERFLPERAADKCGAASQDTRGGSGRP